MVSKKAIIGIAVVVIVVVIIAAIAAGGGSSSDERQADGRYDYDAVLSDSIPDNVFSHPDEGMQYLIITYTLANDGYDELTTNFMANNWTATCGGLTYSDDDFLSVTCPQYQLVSITAGHSAVSQAVIEVPADATLDDIEIGYEYDNWDDAEIVFDAALMS